MTVRQWVTAGYAGVFILGAAAGGAFVQWRIIARQTAMFDQQDPRATYLWSLDQRLGLDDGQKSKIEAILVRYDPLRAQAIAPVEAELTRLRADMRREMRGALNPDQQRTFDELMRRHDERRERRISSAATPAPSPSAQIH